MLVFCFLTAHSNVQAAPCDGSKSAFFDAIANDSASLVESNDITFGETKTLIATLGTLRQRSGARVIFTAPGTGNNLKKANITITTSALDPSLQIFQFAFGPLNNGVTSCQDRGFTDFTVNGTANAPTTLTENTLNSLASNNGNSSYVILTSVQGISGDTSTQGVTLEANLIPGQSYEATCGSVAENGALNTSYDCNILVKIPGSNGDSNNGNDNPDSGNPEPPVEITPAAVKVQPETNSTDCPLSSLEHLNLAIESEQALKLRLSEQAEEIQKAFDAISKAGVNPGPAIRRFDALTASIRDDIGDTRNIVNGGLDFSVRHLNCAKVKLADEQLTAADRLNAELEIDQALAGDNAAKDSIISEDNSINDPGLRLKASLENTVRNLDNALADKEQAGGNLSSSFQMPDFKSSDVSTVYDNFKDQVADMANDLINKLDNSKKAIQASSDKKQTVDAILEVQNTDCINDFFDEVVQEYTKVHTLVKKELKEIAEANENDDEQTSATPAQVKAANKAIKQVDKSFKSTIKALKRTQKRTNSTLNSGLVGSQQSRTNRKIRALLKLLRKANLSNDRVWRRMIRRQLKRLAGFNGGV
jgi:hypothetical protein